MIKTVERKKCTGLQETSRIHHKTLFPATWNPYLTHFKMKRFSTCAATLGFHLVSAVTASHLCSVKGQSIQTAPRTFQKFMLWRHTVSHCVTLPPASTAAERKSFCSSAGISCTATQRQLLHQDQDPSSYQLTMLLFHTKVTTLLRWWRYREMNACSKGPIKHAELRAE